MRTRRLVKKYLRCGCREEVDMKEIRLYNYQAEMKERIDVAFRSYRSVMVQMPTGTGKTILLAEVVKSEERRVKNSMAVETLSGYGGKAFVDSN